MNYQCDSQIGAQANQTYLGLVGADPATDPTNPDSDNDGMPDGWEIQNRRWIGVGFDGGNNWTIYWNYTLDEKGNAIAEEFNRVGNSPWASITTYTWGYGYENSASSQGAGSSEDGDDSSSSTWLILLIIILILATAFMIYSRTQLDNVSTLAKVDTNKIIKKLLEEE